MKDVNVGVIGLGNVGSGTLAILHKNSAQIAQKLGFNLRVVAVCSRSVLARTVPDVPSDALHTADWREVVSHPDVHVVAELVGGTTAAREMIEAAIAVGKSIVTANKELMALEGAEIWDRAIKANIN
ncbi:MAG: homoserine dehydrogenase, partial [Bryobacterales bacterium]|nr:homoserine dehydrogenase [Bryobacterales bacterium]